MQLSCPSCHASVPAQDVNIARLVAKCAACDELFAFERPLTRAGDPPPRPPRLVVEPDEPPTKTQTYRSAPAKRPPLVIRRKRPKHLGLLFFCVMWDGLLALLLVAAFAGDAPLPIFAGLLTFLAFGGVITYQALGGLLNTTTFRIENGVLSVRDDPLSMLASESVDGHLIERLYVHRMERHDEPEPRWTLRAETSDGGTFKLFAGLSREEAEYLAWALAKHLGLRDERA